MPDTNFAYKSQMGTADSIHNLLDTLDVIKKTKNTNAGILSLNFSKAFDMINHTYIIVYLNYIGCPEDFVNYFQVNLDTESASIIGSDKESFLIAAGMLQGRCSSGRAFLFFSAPAILRLNKSKILWGIAVLSPVLKTQTNIPDEINQLPLTNAFADDTSISLVLTCDEAGKLMKY